METCLLCLQINNEIENNIKVNSTQWQELNIETLIDKHFWPMMQTIQLTAWMCCTCWNKLQEFHKFYISIEDAHMNLGSILKLEILNESHIEADILQKESPENELFTEEHKALIKLDEEEDDLPLVAIKKCQQKETISPDKTILKDPLITTTTLQQTKIIETEFKKLQDATKNKTTPNELPIEQTLLTADHDTLETSEIYDYEFNTDTDSNSDQDDQEFLATNKKIPRCNRSKGINDAKNKFISDNFKIICNICQNPIKTFQELLFHFKEEHQQKGYVLCCDKKFFKRNLFLDHLHHHVDPNYLKCNECDKVFTNKRCLKNHKRVHEINRSKNHCCDICGMNFFTRSGLFSHKTRHLTDEEKMFQCPKCVKKFGNKWKLLDHVKKVHGTNEVCDVCGLILVNKSALNKHKLLKHTEQEKREFICPICSKISPNQHGLTTHINNVHKRDYKYKCTTCDRAFKRPISLKEHIATHTGTDLYFCPWCPRTCKSNAYMNSHRKKCHPKEWAEGKLKKYSGNITTDVKLSLEKIINDE